MPDLRKVIPSDPAGAALALAMAQDVDDLRVALVDPVGPLTGSGSANGAVLVGPVDTSRMARVAVRTSGTFSATVQWEVSYDNGATWDLWRLDVMDSTGSTTGSTSTGTSSATFAGPLAAPLFQVKISAYTSGTVTVRVWLSPIPMAPPAAVSIRHTDRTTFTDGSSAGNPVLGLYNEAATDPASGQAAAVRITAERGMHVNLRDAAGAEVAPATQATLASVQTAVDGLEGLAQQQLTELVGLADTDFATGADVATVASAVSDLDAAMGSPAQAGEAAAAAAGKATEATLEAARVLLQSLYNSTYPARPSEKAGRTFFAHTRSSAGTFRTVTAGKTAYITSVTLGASNSHETADLEVYVTGDAGVALIRVVVPMIGVAAALGEIFASQAANLHCPFPEPLRVGAGSTITLNATGGTLGFIRGTVIGYEE